MPARRHLFALHDGFRCRVVYARRLFFGKRDCCSQGADWGTRRDLGKRQEIAGVGSVVQLELGGSQGGGLPQKLSPAKQTPLQNPPPSVPHCSMAQSWHWTALILDSESSLECHLMRGLRQLATACPPHPRTKGPHQQSRSPPWHNRPHTGMPHGTPPAFEGHPLPPTAHYTGCAAQRTCETTVKRLKESLKSSTCVTVRLQSAPQAEKL